MNDSGIHPEWAPQANGQADVTKHDPEAAELATAVAALEGGAPRYTLPPGVDSYDALPWRDTPEWRKAHGLEAIRSHYYDGLRELTDHRVNPANDQVGVFVMDTPGAGGACHVYDVVLPGGAVTRISFQNGPIAEAGVNGLTHEVLLAIIADRLRSFQAGPYACRENEAALFYTETVQWMLKERTRLRMQRGVEGTHKV